MVAKPLLILMFCSLAQAKEIALTFDDAPVPSSQYFSSENRTETLIRKLRDLNAPSALIFANPCKRLDRKAALSQLQKYRDAGHLIGNHTCSHLRFDEVGFDEFSKDTKKADERLKPLFSGQKYFRFPYLNEGSKQSARNQMRTWLSAQGYRNGSVTIDNDDTELTVKLHKAKRLGKKIDDPTIARIFTRHILTAANFYDDVAKKLIGRSPKHVLLLHEVDGTVLYIDVLIRELRKEGWKIISAEEAYTDPLYSERPDNTESGGGLIAQLYFEKHGKSLIKKYYDWRQMNADLDRVL